MRRDLLGNKSKGTIYSNPSLLQLHLESGSFHITDNIQKILVTRKRTNKDKICDFIAIGSFIFG